MIFRSYALIDLMKICRFNQRGDAGIGLIKDHATLLDLTPADISRLQPLLENDDAVTQLKKFAEEKLPQISLAAV